jgi:hypothetical protein
MADALRRLVEPMNMAHAHDIRYLDLNICRGSRFFAAAQGRYGVCVEMSDGMLRMSASLTLPATFFPATSSTRGADMFGEYHARCQSTIGPTRKEQTACEDEVPMY